ncbi:MAG: tryptophan synthase subunit beta [Bdellovibrionales bacterium]|nr:tryptophan synthase subunit beta [Bdellovibrionales bacterium]
MKKNKGRFGRFGGQYAPETLMEPLIELEKAFEKYSLQKDFWEEYHGVLTHFVGRPTPLTLAARLSKELGKAKIYLKREDLAHTGAHKINNCVGQIILARRLGKSRIVAETGAGQHGVATATVCALYGMKCTIYMGEVDMKRQSANVCRMGLLGAEVRCVKNGQKTLKDATSEAMRDWVTHIHNTHYLIGSALGPHPYPRMVSAFQNIIGLEARAQIMELEKRLPHCIVACIGGGSNAIGIFKAFLEDKEVSLVGVEGGGRQFTPGQHASRIGHGRVGVLQGSMTWVLQDEHGQTLPTHSISAGLDYPAIGPEHAFLAETGRVQYTSATDSEAIAAFHRLSQLEGIIPALESSHAIAHACKIAPQLADGSILLVNLSGRGDKDIESIRNYSEKNNE